MTLTGGSTVVQLKQLPAAVCLHPNRHLRVQHTTKSTQHTVQLLGMSGAEKPARSFTRICEWVCQV